MRTIRYIIALAAAVFIAAAANAESAHEATPLQSAIRINGRAESTITKAQITLEDIADVTSRDLKDDDALIALKRIAIAQSPAPGAETTIAAMSIVDKLRQAGVDLKQVGYMAHKQSIGLADAVMKEMENPHKKK